MVINLDRYQAGLVSEALAYRIERLQREHVDQYQLEALDGVLKAVDKAIEEEPEEQQREGHPDGIAEKARAGGTFGAF